MPERRGADGPGSKRAGADPAGGDAAADGRRRDRLPGSTCTGGSLDLQSSTAEASIGAILGALFDIDKDREINLALAASDSARIVVHLGIDRARRSTWIVRVELGLDAGAGVAPATAAEGTERHRRRGKSFQLRVFARDGRAGLP